jgi:hypothetical protein
MKRFLLTAMLLCTGPAFAGPAEDAYVATRDKAIAALNRKNIKPEQQSEREKLALADLTRQLKAIVGPYEVKGFEPTGKINLETLIKEVGFGMLDGLSFQGRDGKSSFVVTTPELFRRWLVGTSKSWAKITNTEQLAEQALKSEDVYTRAVTSDAALLSFGELPIRKASPVALALLAAQTQDDSVMLQPAVVVVSTLTGDRVVIAQLEPAIASGDIPACSEIFKSYETRANALYEKYRASGLKDTKLFDQYTKLQTEGGRAYRRCYGEKIRGTPYFDRATAQAQDFLDSLPK